MANKNTSLGGTDWTDDIPLVAADLNDTFDVVARIDNRIHNQIGFTYEQLDISGASSTMYASGDVIAKFKLTGGTGNLINNISARLDFYAAYSTRPTYTIEYSTDNSAWTTFGTEPTAIANTTLGELGGLTGTVDGLSNATYYIRIVGSSQASFTAITSFNLMFHTLYGGSKTLVMKAATLRLQDGADVARNAMLDTAASSALKNIVLPTVISAPNGETITSVSAVGILAGQVASSSATGTSSIEYSTDGTTYAAMDEGNSETTSGTNVAFIHQHYGLKESLSSNDVYVAFHMDKDNTSWELDASWAHLFVVATY